MDTEEKRAIVLGQAFVVVISTPHWGGNAEKLLRAIGRDFDGSHIQRSFPGWMHLDGVTSTRGSVFCQGREYALVLQIGREQGLVIRETERHTLSLKPMKNSANLPGKISLAIGKQPITDNRISSHANNLVASWLVHGRYWQNRIGEVIYQPYGLEKM